MSGEMLWAPVAGKYGRTRDGRKALISGLKGNATNQYYSGTLDGITVGWAQDGHCINAMGLNLIQVSNGQLDLVSEWVDDPAPAQPVNFSKIRVGDEIEVRRRLKVDLIHEDGRPGVMFDNGFRYYKPTDILAHIPAVRPIKVGSFVIGESLPCSNPHKVLAIVDGQAWVKAGDHSQTIASVDDLTRIDDEAA